MSFILDALRKSEHERQRSAVPGLSQVPLATPQPHLPRWAVIVMGVLAAVVLAVSGAWWQSTRARSEVTAPAPRTVERSVELPPLSRPSAAPQQAAPSRPSAPEPRAASRQSSLEAAAGDVTPSAAAASTAPASAAPVRLELPADAPALPSAAMLAAEGIFLPSLRLELHAFSAQPSDRFVFINGRKYVEGERLVEGPQLLSIAPTGAVLVHAGRRFLLAQE